MHSDWETKFEYCPYTVRLLDKIQIIAQESGRHIDLYVIKKAIHYAKTYHGAQTRDSGEPFYSHPLEVAYMLADYLPRLDLLVTAILHDTIEDTTLTRKMIAENFGETIANKVGDLTRIKENGKISSKEMVALLWQQKKLDVLLIKLFDRVHNVQTIGAKSPEKAMKILSETLNHILWIAPCLGCLSAESTLVETCHQFLSNENQQDINVLSLDRYYKNHYNNHILNQLITNPNFL